ncbi:unnamed protein product [Schistosoma curassoni]|uniref:Secreted protein n=1 Tax=Schistosoma curassoni TaxID=6186 RepID=A0A183KNC9_9TREM|nr:unnamed protein product [Schistosoma curassoni]
MLSGPAALLLLIFLMVMLIYSIVGGPTLIGRSASAASILDEFSGTGRFKSSLKCYTHLFRCSPMLLITLPFLLFSGRSGLRFFPESFFVMSYSSNRVNPGVYSASESTARFNHRCLCHILV